MASKRKVKQALAKRISDSKKEADKPKFLLEEFCFDKQLEFIKDPARFKTAVCSRRCLAENTLVQTTLGPKYIQDITTEDFVYDEHGAPIKVKATYYNGEREVLAVKHQGRVLLKATSNHVFLTQQSNKDFKQERSLSNFNSRTKISRQEISRDHGANIPYAYALGALLGDGCSTESNNSYIVISSADDKIPNTVASQLDATRVKKAHPSNYSYNIYLDHIPELYSLWCKNKKAHEKTCDIDTILSWDRESRIAFIAGLIDTDGSVSYLSDGISIRISMQAKSVIDAARMLILDLWGYDPTIYEDNRDKYKNGSVFEVRLKHTYFAQRILEEITPYLKSEKKKLDYKKIKVKGQYNPTKVGVILEPAGYEKTYDIHVESASNLYTLANGLITHNSGKTVSCAADLINTALSHSEGDVLYATLNRKTAKRIIWKELLAINKNYELGAHVNNQELTLTFPHGKQPTIHITGAKDNTEIEKFRGMALRKVYIDECQSFRSYIGELVEDVFEPCLTDYDGSLMLIGTPSPIPAGFFYNAAHNGEWSSFKWTMADNPYIQIKSGKPVEQILAELRKRRGINANDPSYMREYLGLWIQDFDSLVYHFKKEKNVYSELPTDLEYVLGIDIGYHDSDAIAVLGYSLSTNRVYLVKEIIKRRQGITPLIKQIEELQSIYKPTKIVMDTGGLGKKIQEELRVRHSIPIHAAEKTRKFEFIELLNDDLRTERFQAFENSVFEQDSYILQWNKDDPYKLKISSGFHTDIGDAVLYGWRECKHYIEQGTVENLNINSDKYMRAMEQEEADRVEFRKHNADWELFEEFESDVEELAKLIDKD